MTQKKKNNIIIGSLCAVVLLMVVGYAAFSSVLNIKGTSKVSSNWNVHISNITVLQTTGSATNAEDPSWDALTGTFKTNLVSPGDAMEYNVEIYNEGTLDAVLEKITLTDSNNPAIKFTASGLEEGTILKAGSTADLTVKVKYLSSVTSQPESTKSEFKVTLDYVQNDGTIVTPTNNVVYRIAVGTLKIGDSIENIETVTDPTKLNSSYFLKHILDDGKIIGSEICFLKNGLYCIKPNEHATNRETMLNVFGESKCHGDDSNYSCSDDLFYLYSFNDESSSSIDVGNGRISCYVNIYNESSCYIQQ